MTNSTGHKLTHELIPNAVSANVWNKHGDLEDVHEYPLAQGTWRSIADVPLSCCGKTIRVHGHVGTHLVCPGMWVIWHPVANQDGSDHLGWEVLSGREFDRKYRMRSKA